jgi:uncharacterized RDD family membrane protein YckC
MLSSEPLLCWIAVFQLSLSPSFMFSIVMYVPLYVIFAYFLIIETQFQEHEPIMLMFDLKVSAILMRFFVASGLVLLNYLIFK